MLFIFYKNVFLATYRDCTRKNLMTCFSASWRIVHRVASYRWACSLKGLASVDKIVIPFREQYIDGDDDSPFVMLPNHGEKGSQWDRQQRNEKNETHCNFFFYLFLLGKHSVMIEYFSQFTIIYSYACKPNEESSYYRYDFVALRA